jgi:glycosyltransferase involved in cell wall biosynthesis
MGTKVSIITPAFTLERINDIKQLLDSVAGQTAKSLEMLLVIENKPGLAEIINQYLIEKGYTGITILYNTGPGCASAARNIALQQAQGDVIAFVDDDAVLDPNWADEIICTFDTDQSVIGVTGPIYPLWENSNMTWFPREFYWIFSCTDTLHSEKVDVRNGYGTNLAFHKEAFQYAGFFNPELGVRGRGREGWQEPGLEETDLCLRVKSGSGKRIVFNPRVRVHHKVYSYRLSRKFIIRRAFWEGYGKALLKDRFRSLISDKKVLATEFTLLRRIFLHLIPRSFIRLFHQPKKAILQLALIFTVLTCVAFGYLRYKLVSFHSRRDTVSQPSTQF